jgi:hypothetical protein
MFFNGFWHPSRIELSQNIVTEDPLSSVISVSVSSSGHIFNVKRKSVEL